MKDSSQIGSLAWWLSVVLVSMLTSLAAAYLKTPIDSFLLRTSSWWRKWSAARLAKREQDIQRIINNPHEEVMLYLSELRSHAKTTEAFVATGLMLMVGVLGFFIAAVLHIEGTNILGYGATCLSALFAIIASYNAGVGTKTRIMVGLVRLRQSTRRKKKAAEIESDETKTDSATLPPSA